MSFDGSVTPKSSVSGSYSTSRSSIDSTSSSDTQNFRFENGNDVALKTTGRHIIFESDLVRETEIEHPKIDEPKAPKVPKGPEDPNVTQSLKPLRDSKLSLVRGKGVFIGASVGLLGGGAVGGLKLAAIGAAIGTMVMPGIGTAVGAVVGGLVGIVGGAVAGGGVGGLIGHIVGKSKAAKVDVESIVKDHAPGSSKFNAIVKDARLHDRKTTNADLEKIQEGLRRALQQRAESGKPIGNKFIRVALTSLVKIQAETSTSKAYSKRGFTDNEKAGLTDALLDLLNSPGRAGLNGIGPAVDMLVSIQWDKDRPQPEKDAFKADVIQQFREQGSIPGADTPQGLRRFEAFAKARYDIANANGLDNAGRDRVTRAVDEIMRDQSLAVDGEEELKATLPTLIALSAVTTLSDEAAQIATDALVKYVRGRLESRKHIDSISMPQIAVGFAAIAGAENMTESGKKNVLDGFAGSVGRRSDLDAELQKEYGSEYGLEVEYQDVSEEFVSQSVQHHFNVEATLRGIQSVNDLDEETWLQLTGDGQPPLEDVTEEDWNNVKADFRIEAGILLDREEPPVKNENTDGYRDLLARVTKQVVALRHSNDEVT